MMSCFSYFYQKKAKILRIRMNKFKQNLNFEIYFPIFKFLPKSFS